MKKIRYLLFLLFIVIACERDTINDSDKGIIEGTVVLKDSNLPVENAKISTNPATSTVFTNEEGKFTILEVDVGDYSVQAQKDSLAPNFEGITVIANNIVNVVFEMQSEDVLNTPPQSPLLISPDDDAINVSTTVDFIWNSEEANLADNHVYTLKLRDEANENQLIYQQIKDTIFKVEGLEFDTQYFWQVSIEDEVNDPVWSEVNSFKTMSFPNIEQLYTKTVDGNYVIFAKAGDQEVQLTASGFNSFRPRRNMETNKIAFLRSVGGDTHVFVMNLDGSNQRQVSAIPVGGFNLNMVDICWIDNGNSILYPNFSTLYKINASGGGTENIYQTVDGSLITEVDVFQNNTFKIALITNDNNGYGAKIFVMDGDTGMTINTIQENLPGAVGGLDFSPGGDKVLYARDVDGYESQNYRQLNSHIFIYDLNNNSTLDISVEKENGTNDLDPKFSPTGAEIIFVNKPNSIGSTPAIYKMDINPNDNNLRELIIDNTLMPDWE